MEKSWLIALLMACFTAIFIGYLVLQTEYPGKGLRAFTNIFKKTISFKEAIKALQQGQRIRRKKERTGYAKIVISEGKNRTEKFGTYWVSSENSISSFCSFEINDVTANDWIIDED